MRIACAAILAVSVLAVPCPAHAQGPFTIDFDPGAYVGRYSVPGYGFLNGPQTVALSTGTYWIDSGAGIGGSSFQIQVDASGNVTSLNTTAAIGSGHTLTFNTTSVAIDPSSYTGNYYLSPFQYTAFLGPQTFDLIDGLVYSVNNGSFLGGSDLRFQLDGLGNVVSLTAEAATGSGNTLTFKTTSVVVDALGYTGQYFLSPFAYTPFTGQETFVLIPGLHYAGNNGAFLGGSAFRFDLDGSGNVTSTTPSAAQGLANTLTLNCVVTRVDPNSFTGSYKINQDTFTGIADVPLLPALVNQVYVSGPSGQMVADLGGATPSSLTFGSNVLLFTVIGNCNGVEVELSLHPRRLKLSSSGNVVTAYITVPDSETVTALDATSPTITEVNGSAVPGVPAFQWDFQDQDQDGTVETLMVKFDRSAVAALLVSGENTIKVEGSFLDARPFEGTDTIDAK